MTEAHLSIGAVSARTGVAPSALRFYEDEGLIHAERTPSGQRRYAKATIRRISFIRAAQQVGLSLDEIGESLRSLPDRRTPTEKDWARLSAAWRPRIDTQIALLERLRDHLDGCIGCGCLSMKICKLVNPGDRVASHGAGPRFLIEDG
jgi:MerR family redox-sensitive transcriptional activator SoxR